MSEVCEHPFSATVREQWTHESRENFSSSSMRFICLADAFCRDCGVLLDQTKAVRPEQNWEDCRVYWGSHGCMKARGHEGHHECECCTCGDNHPFPDWPDRGVHCVAKFPFYTYDADDPETNFYGEDA